LSSQAINADATAAKRCHSPKNFDQKKLYRAQFTNRPQKPRNPTTTSAKIAGATTTTTSKETTKNKHENNDKKHNANCGNSTNNYKENEKNKGRA